MAQLDSLLVQGIRSIGPDGSDAHVIKFQNPLTIIAGPNGSGKTTLIEALNFITTDTKPSGQYPAFIHNLEVCGRARVDALVKLKFFAANGKQVTATKRLNLSRAARTNKITGKQDESTLVIVDQYGQKISLSSKVADTKTEMINLLDVPRAILTNVIFCHQENSTWPLGEPKQVKEKFDAIFELSKYVKILEKLRKMAKDQTQNLNVIHAELNHMQSNYDDRLKKEANREELQDRLLKLKQDIAKYNEKKQEVMDIFKEASGKMEVYQEFSNARMLATSHLNVQLEQLKHFNVPDYSGSEQELLEAIRQITDSSEFKNIESRRITVEKQMAELEASISMLEKQKRLLEAERLDVHTNTKMKEDYVDRIANLHKMIRKEYGFQSTDITSAMEAFIEKEGASLKQYRAHQQEERQNLETRKNDVMEKRQQAKHEIRTGSDQKRKLETDIEILNTKINTVSSGQNELQSLQKRIVALEKERSDLGEVDLSALDKIKQQRDKAQDELTRLKDQCAAAEVFEETERSLVRLKQEMREAAEKLEELTAKNTADLTLVFDTKDQSFPISASIKDKVVSVRKELDFANKEHNSIEVELELAKSAEQRYFQEQIQLENQIKELEKGIGELTDLTPPEKVSLKLAELRTQLRNNQKELNPLESKFELYETWIEETEAKNCCPLCDRRFASKMAKNELVEKLTNLRVSTPREIERLSETVTALDDQEKSFAKAEGNVQNLNVLTEKLRKLQVERKESKSKVTETETKLKKIKDELTLVQKSSEACNRILVDAAIMDSLDLQIQKTKKEISEAEHLLSQKLKAGRGYLELKQERQELEEKISSLLGEGDKLQLEANKRNKLSEELMPLQSRRLELGDNAANLSHFENQLKEKREEVAELSSSICSLKTLLPELCEEESDAVQAIKDHDKNTKVEEMKKEEQIREIGRYQIDLEKLNKSLEDCEEKLEKQGDVQSEYDRLNEKMTQASQKLGDLKGQLNAPDHLKEKRRRLEDQSSRMVIMKNVEKYNEILAKEWTGEDIQAIKAAAREAQVTHDLCVRRIGEKDGLRKEIEKNIESLKAELNEPRFSKSDDKLRKKLVEKVVAECAHEDLKNYATKVEQTLLVFHRSKMEAINEILENLWRRVYRGTDIDTIRIKSELSEGSGARTKYDYQVMMVLENGVEVEMRDRCSAGQKMLASILIRIALSDVFGSQCSILALDEPTTNLDVQKIDDMAAMIIDLINARSVDGDDDEDRKPKRQHFQMIIITHDERFVATLKRDVRPEIIYHVSKNEDGKSRIVQETNFGERN